MTGAGVLGGQTQGERRHGWGEPPSEQQVRARYRWLSAIYPAFEWVFWLPRNARAEAVRRMDLRPGGVALEVGCGTGRNLGLLREAVGPSGRVYGVDLSPEMLSVARRTSARNRSENLRLLEGDAEKVVVPEPVDAALFSLSYAVLPRYRAILAGVWRRLRPGGRVVVLNAEIPEGVLGDVLRPLALAVSRRTVLGDPFRRPWEDLSALGGEAHKTALWPGVYYLCWADRPDLGSDHGRPGSREAERGSRGSGALTTLVQNLPPSAKVPT